MNYIVTFKDDTVKILSRAELDKAQGVLGVRELTGEEAMIELSKEVKRLEGEFKDAVERYKLGMCSQPELEVHMTALAQARNKEALELNQRGG